MKKLTLLIFTLLFVFPAFGQNRYIVGGGGGHFMIGATYVFAQDVIGYLQEPTVVGPDYEPTPLDIQAGGEGYTMIGRFSLGGGGFGFGGFTASSPNGKVKQRGGGGYLKLGYRFYEKNTSFAMVNAGVGGFGYSLKIKNTSTEHSIMFNQLEPILPDKEKTYRYGGTLFDLGVSFKSVVTRKQNLKKMSGFIAGMDAGCLMGVPSWDWKGDDEIQGPPEPGLMVTPYIRLTIGLGVFKLE
ncbi:MAG: hypothetical protein K9J37_11335 [Saprospiraceae bacterium]|nr:hypothetical protein [Saprospiraceae bacterium]MCF8250498.1 hypothetical protein [Saprospiraceae bacterium]MCF8279638.1 hypothetical protein [Bacteroidales bacterium]MCF8312424.1 hypothetical protein [Saprospiraceae bacterium]MCF8440759.1 hypothetical protein [Saprospiraceae bacterium]